MSRRAKMFLVGATATSILTIWGVHFVQKRESDSMYQGVVRDEARLRERALEIERLSTPSTPTTSPSSSGPVQQPEAVIDPDCVTCVASPPPQLLEAQSKEARAIERAERLAEYEAQKKLGTRLEREQSVRQV